MTVNNSELFADLVNEFLKVQSEYENLMEGLSFERVCERVGVTEENLNEFLSNQAFEHDISYMKGQLRSWLEYSRHIEALTYVDEFACDVMVNGGNELGFGFNLIKKQFNLINIDFFHYEQAHGLSGFMDSLGSLTTLFLLATERYLKNRDDYNLLLINTIKSIFRNLEIYGLIDLEPQSEKTIWQRKSFQAQVLADINARREQFSPKHWQMLLKGMELGYSLLYCRVKYTSAVAKAYTGAKLKPIDIFKHLNIEQLKSLSQLSK